MKTEEIKQLFLQFETAASEIEGVECWSARELQSLLGYSKWENFHLPTPLPINILQRLINI